MISKCHGDDVIGMDHESIRQAIIALADQYGMLGEEDLISDFGVVACIARYDGTTDYITLFHSDMVAPHVAYGLFDIGKTLVEEPLYNWEWDEEDG